MTIEAKLLDISEYEYEIASEKVVEDLSKKHIYKNSHTTKINDVVGLVESVSFESDVIIIECEFFDEEYKRKMQADICSIYPVFLVRENLIEGFDRVYISW